MSTPHLVLVVTLSEWGGAQHYVHQLARAARGAYDVTVLCGPGGLLVERLRTEGIRVVEIPGFRRNLHPVRDAQAFLQLAHFLRGERVDLLHANSTKAGLLARMAAPAARVPVVVFTAHGWAFTEGRPPWVQRFLAKTESFGARLATRIICVSEYDRDLAVRFGVASRGRMTVIRNGVDPDPFLRDYKATGTRPTIVMIGRLVPPKDPLCLVDAVRRLPEARLVFLGDGPLRTRIEAAARRGGVDARVSLLGSRPDVAAVLRTCDIFALPSRWEGLPFAVIEAMMAGLPVVATRVGGLPELVEHGVTGFLVPAGDAGALEEALRALVTDETLRRRMGAAGRQRALREFTADRMVRETLALYASLIQRSGRVNLPDPVNVKSG